jgi:hypothetical protein
MTEPIDLIARELGKSRIEAQNFVLEIRKTIGVSVDYSEILNVMRQIGEYGKRATTPEAVAILLRARKQPSSVPTSSSKTTQDKSKAAQIAETQTKGKIAKIATELRADIKTAKNFVAKVRQLVGKPIKYSVILDTLKQIKDPKQATPDTIASLIPTQTLQALQIKEQKSIPITKAISILRPIIASSSRQTESTLDKITIELNLSKEVANEFTVQVRQLLNQQSRMLGLGKFKIILKAIKWIKNQQKEVTPQLVAFIITSPEFQKSLHLQVTHPSLPKARKSEIQIAKITPTSQILLQEFETDSRQSIETLFAEFELRLEIDQARLKAKDDSIFTFDLLLLDRLFDLEQNYLQGLADQAIARQEFDKLEQLIILVVVLSFGPEAKLEREIAIRILNAIAIDIVRDNCLIVYIGHQIVIQARPRKLVNIFVHWALLSLYYRANLVRDKCYIAYFDTLGKPSFRVLPSQKLSTLYIFADHSIWTLVWKLSSASLSLILPNLRWGETWVNRIDIPDTFHTTTYQSNALTFITALLNYGRDCYIDLQNRRRYQVPSQGRAEIIASDRLKKLLGLNSIRFIQEDIEAPGILLRFEFGLHQPAIGLVKVNKDGTTEGFHEFIWFDNSFRTIIEAVALAYYRDLVTPGKIHIYKPGSGGLRTEKPLNPVSPHPRKLPRPQNIPLHAKNNPRLRDRAFHELHTWHEARERARHLVVGHTRWIGKGFIADPEKQRQALAHLGKKLPSGYTFVIEHDRGELSNSGLKLTSDGYLTERTLFLPPERASTELDKLLS